MCVIFYYIAKYSVSPPKHHFKFILAANRDEFYFRSSIPAQFWKTDPNILAGQDLESCGTWLGINKKTGRLAAVTNIMGGTEKDPQKPKISRGALITNFLSTQSTLNGELYCKSLHADPTVSYNFNKFNLLTIDFPKHIQLSDQKLVPLAYYFTNASDAPPVSPNSNEDGQTEYFGLGNSTLYKPFQKVINGCTAFQAIVENYHYPNSSKSVENLTEDLLKFLRSDVKNFPDPQIESQANKQVASFTPFLSSTFVCIPKIMYGTRTHTLIYVDYNNQVYFTEFTMTEPIVPEQPTWHESNYKFQLFS